MDDMRRNIPPIIRMQINVSDNQWAHGSGPALSLQNPRKLNRKAFETHKNALLGGSESKKPI